ncbi:hypothetical protein PROFUN_05911 [Planoprotostelium fungivorum]|uniref:Ras-GAP domain-containing protein n=1 Tax=Planoprotostelium fungivorum TaxID=1890364 RepID=A0A2P6N7L0_9EUKA|nr:hypothetical protein PROFUN_05911 [Planoprotostelium fungivorum]
MRGLPLNLLLLIIPLIVSAYDNTFLFGNSTLRISGMMGANQYTVTLKPLSNGQNNTFSVPITVSSPIPFINYNADAEAAVVVIPSSSGSISWILIINSRTNSISSNFSIPIAIKQNNAAALMLMDPPLNPTNFILWDNRLAYAFNGTVQFTNWTTTTPNFVCSGKYSFSYSSTLTGYMQLNTFAQTTPAFNKTITLGSGSFSNCSVFTANNVTNVIMILNNVGFAIINTLSSDGLTLSYQDYAILSDPTSRVTSLTVDINNQVIYWMDNNGNISRGLDDHTMTPLGSGGSGSMTFLSSTDQIAYVTTSTPSIRYVSVSNCISCTKNDPTYCMWNEVDVICVDRTAPNNYAYGTLYSETSQCPTMNDTTPSLGPISGNTTLNMTIHLSMYHNPTGNWTCVIDDKPVQAIAYKSTNGSVNLQCMTPPHTLANSTESDNVTVYVRYKNSIAPYTQNNFTYTYTDCSVADTIDDCMALVTPVGCGWCNYLSLCTHRIDCTNVTSWLQDVPHFSSISPTEFAVGVKDYTLTFTGNFKSSANYTWNYARGQENYTAPLVYINDTQLQFTLSKNTTLRGTYNVDALGSTFMNNTATITLTIVDCVSLTNCTSCLLSTVCNWCQNQCNTSNTNLPCVTATQYTPLNASLSFYVGVQCQLASPKVSSASFPLGQSILISLWYNPSPNNYSALLYSLTENTNQSIAMVPISQKRQATSDGNGGNYTLDGSTLTPGRYNASIYHLDQYFDRLPSVFVVYDCPTLDTCEKCVRSPYGCAWNGTCDLGTLVRNGMSCPASTSNTDAILPPPAPPSKTTEYIIIGVVVGLVVILIIIVIVAIVFIRKRRESQGKDISLPPPPDFSTVGLEKDTSPMFNIPASVRPKLAQLEELLMDNNIERARALSSIPSGNEQDQFGKFYMYLAMYRGRDVPSRLLLRYINIEIDKTKQETTLFRLTSVSTSMFTSYAKINGLEYLWKVLASPIWDIIVQAPDGDSPNTETINMEVDPDKIGQEEKDFMDANIYQLLAVLSKIFTRIRKSDAMSPEFRRILKQIRQLVGERYPNSEQKAVGSFMFLRYVVPSIVAPHVYHLLQKPPSASAQRMLVLVSRVMQNLANETLPSLKAEHMVKLDQFIIDNLPPLHQLYDRITTDVPATAEGPSVVIPETTRDNALAWMHNFIVRNRNKIEPKPELQVRRAEMNYHLTSRRTSWPASKAPRIVNVCVWDISWVTLSIISSICVSPEAAQKRCPSSYLGDVGGQERERTSSKSVEFPLSGDSGKNINSMIRLYGNCFLSTTCELSLWVVCSSNFGRTNITHGLHNLMIVPNQENRGEQVNGAEPKREPGTQMHSHTQIVGEDSYSSSSESEGSDSGRKRKRAESPSLDDRSKIAILLNDMASGSWGRHPSTTKQEITLPPPPITEQLPTPISTPKVADSNNLAPVNWVVRKTNSAERPTMTANEYPSTMDPNQWKNPLAMGASNVPQMPFGHLQNPMMAGAMFPYTFNPYFMPPPPSMNPAQYTMMTPQASSDLRHQMPKGSEMPSLMMTAHPYMHMQNPYGGMFGMAPPNYPANASPYPIPSQMMMQNPTPSPSIPPPSFPEPATRQASEFNKKDKKLSSTHGIKNNFAVGRTSETNGYTRPQGGPQLNKGSRFRLLEEPDEMQRKSYKKENRCLHPNPLVICKRDAKNDNTKLTDGFVTVKLVDSEGRELPPSRTACLESIDGGLTHPLDEDCSTVFSLKILQTSQGQLFRLLFTVTYRVKGSTSHEEKIYSEPFGVYSNKLRRQAQLQLQRANGAAVQH